MLICIQAHEEVLREREETIRELSAKHHLLGYDHSPLEREKIIEFITRLTDLQRTQNSETDTLQVKKDLDVVPYYAKIAVYRTNRSDRVKSIT